VFCNVPEVAVTVTVAVMGGGFDDDPPPHASSRISPNRVIPAGQSGTATVTRLRRQ
jgi:hypothetical protein